MYNRSGIDSRDMLSRQVRSLQLQLSELELRADWHLRRVHELEAYLGGRPLSTGSAQRPPTDTPVHLRGGTHDASSHPDRLADDDRQRIRWLERQIKAQDVDLRQKEIAITELTAAVQQGHGLLERVSAEAVLLREASEHLTAQLHAKDREIVELAATADERLRLVEQQALAVEEKERMIVDLAATAEARLRLIEELDAAVTRANEALERQASALHEVHRPNEDPVATAGEQAQAVDLVRGDFPAGDHTSNVAPEVQTRDAPR